MNSRRYLLLSPPQLLVVFPTLEIMNPLTVTGLKRIPAGVGGKRIQKQAGVLNQMQKSGTLLLFPALLGLSACGGSDIERPTARFEVECFEFYCQFDASESSSPRQGDITYVWEFGDGTATTGQKTGHLYEETGEYTVKLNIVDAGGIPANTSKTVNTTSSVGQDYYLPVRRSISIPVFLFETLEPVVIAGDSLQDSAETQGPPDEDGYTLSCSDSGTALVREWTDTDSSATINGSESLLVTAQDCTDSNGNKLNSVSELGLQSDFDGNNFSLVMPTDVGSGISTQIIESIRLRGPIDLAVTRSGAAIDRIQIDAPDLNLVFESETASPFVVSGGFTAIETSFGSFDNITGNFEFRYGSGASVPATEVTIVQPLTISESSEGLQIVAGVLEIKQETATIHVSVASDPQFISIEIDANSDGTIDITDLFAQKIVALRLGE